MRYKNLRLIAVAVLALSLLLLAGCGDNTAKTMGVVDMDKVVQGSAKIKQLQSDLDTKAKSTMEKMEKDQKAMSTAEFQKSQEATYGEFIKYKQGLEKQMETAIEQTLEQVAKEKKLTIVLHKGAMHQGGIDITEDVIKKMQ